MNAPKWKLNENDNLDKSRKQLYSCCAVSVVCALISTFTSFLRRLDPDVVNCSAPRQAWPWHGPRKSGGLTRRWLPLPASTQTQASSHLTSFSVYLRIANDLCKEWKIIVLNGKNTLDINQSYNIQNPQNSVIHWSGSTGSSVVTIIGLFAVNHCSPYITSHHITSPTHTTSGISTMRHFGHTPDMRNQTEIDCEGKI